MRRRLNSVVFPLTLPALALYLRHQLSPMGFSSYFSTLAYMIALMHTPLISLAWAPSFL
ncbi:uncharacterized protein EDB91DRAFT_1161772, partial [Suillus paluster]|uniref:uncharacterized protein n=1 Tax=Suillus paluster TaxID=48578 RepID=UPI001B868345